MASIFKMKKLIHRSAKIVLVLGIALFSYYLFAPRTIWTKEMNIDRSFLYLVKRKESLKPDYSKCIATDYFLVDEEFLNGNQVSMTCDGKQAFTLSTNQVIVVGNDIDDKDKVSVEANYYATGAVSDVELVRTPGVSGVKQVELRVESRGQDFIYIYEVNGEKVKPEKLIASWW